MEILSSYNIIIAVSVIIIVSFLFNSLSKKTNVPAVLMLIVFGVGLQYLLKYFDAGEIQFLPILEVLGIVGLIMIVLEAALEFELKREK
jgi:Kef-type K+ transport system membrane component KefB